MLLLPGLIQTWHACGLAYPAGLAARVPMLGCDPSASWARALHCRVGRWRASGSFAGFARPHWARLTETAREDSPTRLEAQCLRQFQSARSRSAGLHARHRKPAAPPL